ncbi:MAG: transposase [Thermomicrobiales bacterium]
MTPESSNPRRKRLRAQGFDYAESGSYFVTICVDQMEHRLGRVQEGRVRLNDAGSLIQAAWNHIPTRFPDVILDSLIVMPNHLHAILFLGNHQCDNAPSLSRIVQTFKSESTIEYGRGVKAGRFPRYERALWQRSFHEKILRDDKMLEAARLYIESNPGRWSETCKG